MEAAEPPPNREALWEHLASTQEGESYDDWTTKLPEKPIGAAVALYHDQRWGLVLGKYTADDAASEKLRRVVCFKQRDDVSWHVHDVEKWDLIDRAAKLVGEGTVYGLPSGIDAPTLEPKPYHGPMKAPETGYTTENLAELHLVCCAAGEKCTAGKMISITFGGSRGAHGEATNLMGSQCDKCNRVTHHLCTGVEISSTTWTCPSCKGVVDEDEDDEEEPEPPPPTLPEFWRRDNRVTLNSEKYGANGGLIGPYVDGKGHLLEPDAPVPDGARWAVGWDDQRITYMTDAEVIEAAHEGNLLERERGAGGLKNGEPADAAAAFEFLTKPNRIAGVFGTPLAATAPAHAPSARPPAHPPPLRPNHRWAERLRVQGRQADGVRLVLDDDGGRLGPARGR